LDHPVDVVLELSVSKLIDGIKFSLPIFRIKVKIKFNESYMLLRTCLSAAYITRPSFKMGQNGYKPCSLGDTI